MCVLSATQGCVSHAAYTNCWAGAPTPACLWPARRTRSRRSSHVVHDTAPIPGIIIPGARGKDFHPRSGIRSNCGLRCVSVLRRTSITVTMAYALYVTSIFLQTLTRRCPQFLRMPILINLHERVRELTKCSGRGLSILCQDNFITCRFGATL